MEKYCQYQQRLLLLSPPLNDHEPLLAKLNPLFALIGLTALWGKTYYGIRWRAAQLSRQGKRLEALKVLIQGLQQKRFWGNSIEKWWQLMHKAITILQHSPGLQMDNTQQVQQLIKLANHGPQPWQGYVVAYCFAALSLWSFQIGKHQKAIEYVSIALHADPSWGYPEYLLGWYGLIVEGIDPIPHLVRAIHTNWSFLQRLKQDPLFQRFPEIQQAVNHIILVKDDALS